MIVGRASGKTSRVVSIGFLLSLVWTSVLATPQGGTLPGGTQNEPSMTYRVEGATLPSKRSVDQVNLHRYDNGSYSPGSTIELWGTAQHNYPATSKVKDVSFRATISYTKRGSSKGYMLAEDKGSISPGTSYDYRISATIPADAYQVRIAGFLGLPGGTRTDLVATFLPAAGP